MTGWAQALGEGWGEAIAACEPPTVACGHVTGHPGEPDHPCVRGVSTARFTPSEVVRAFALAPGEPHRRPWLGVVGLVDGRVAVVRAWCCGAGFGCHQGGTIEVARDLETLLRYGLSREEASRLGVGLG